MRKMSLLFAVLLAACAAPAAEVTPVPQPAQPAPFDPVGTYDFTTEVQGNAVSGTVVVRRGDQGLLAEITTQVTGTFQATATQDGRKLALRAATPDGNMTMTMTVDEADVVTGSWSLDSGMSGNISGKKRRS